MLNAEFDEYALMRDDFSFFGDEIIAHCSFVRNLKKLANFQEANDQYCEFSRSE
jgi:hypothetical protein